MVILLSLQVRVFNHLLQRSHKGKRFIQTVGLMGKTVLGVWSPFELLKNPSTLHQLFLCRGHSSSHRIVRGIRTRQKREEKKRKKENLFSLHAMKTKGEFF